MNESELTFGYIVCLFGYSNVVYLFVPIFSLIIPNVIQIILVVSKYYYSLYMHKFLFFYI